MKIAVIIAHFGGLPPWFPLWMQTASSNTQIDFHIFCDSAQNCCAGNIVWHKLSLESFNDLPAVNALGLSLQRPYKLCDLRPAFGAIFADLISSYDYWGWGDLDVIYGDIMGCLAERFGKYEYIATGWNGASGPLALLKNSCKINNLFLKIEDHQRKMNDTVHYGLDEIDILEVLKSNVTCDIVFRECLYDLPARLRAGKLKAIFSRREYVLHHFGGRLSFHRQRIIQKLPYLIRSLEVGDGIYIRRDGQITSGNGEWYTLKEKILRKLSHTLIGFTI